MCVSWFIVSILLIFNLFLNSHLIFNFALSKLYTNALMSSLNSRAQWKVKFGASGHLSVGGRSGQTSQTLTKGRSKVRVVKSGTCHVDISNGPDVWRWSVQPTRGTSLLIVVLRWVDEIMQVLVHVERHQMRDWNDMEPKFPVSPRQDETIVKFKPSADNLDYDYAADVEYSSQEHPDTPKSQDIGNAVWVRGVEVKLNDILDLHLDSQYYHLIYTAGLRAVMNRSKKLKPPSPRTNYRWESPVEICEPIRGVELAFFWSPTVLCIQASQDHIRIN